MYVLGGWKCFRMSLSGVLAFVIEAYYTVTQQFVYSCLTRDVRRCSAGQKLSILSLPLSTSHCFHLPFLFIGVSGVRGLLNRRLILPALTPLYVNRH